MREAWALTADVRFDRKVGEVVAGGFVMGPLLWAGGAGVQGQVGREARYWLLMCPAEYLQLEIGDLDASFAISSALSLP